MKAGEIWVLNDGSHKVRINSIFECPLTYPDGTSRVVDWVDFTFVGEGGWGDELPTFTFLTRYKKDYDESR